MNVTGGHKPGAGVTRYLEPMALVEGDRPWVGVSR